MRVVLPRFISPSRLSALVLLGTLGACTSAGPAPPPLPDELLAASIAHHDPDGVWGRERLTLEIAESRPDGTERTTRLVLDPSGERFELERRDGDKRIEGLIAPGECFWNIAAGNFSVEEIQGLSCESLERTRDYYAFLWGLPMKLRDPGTRLGEVSRVEVDGAWRWRLRVTYDPEVGGDVWDLDFDPETSALVGYRFFHDEAAGDGEWISLDGELAGAGLRLPRDRSWYMNADDEFLGRDRLTSVE